MCEFKIRVPFSAVGTDRLLKTDRALSLMLDSCQFQEEEERPLYDFLRQRHLVLFLLFVQMDILRLPAFGENIVPGVKIYGMKPLYGLRRTSIKSDSGELLVVANALGAFFDLEKGRAAVIDPSEVPCAFDEPEPMTCLPRKIPLPGEGGVPGEPFVVRRSQIDMNGHMTSCEYLAEAVNALADADSFDRIRIEYKQQAKLGEKLVPVVFRTPAASVVDLRNATGHTCALVEFSHRACALKPPQGPLWGRGGFNAMAV